MATANLGGEISKACDSPPHNFAPITAPPGK